MPKLDIDEVLYEDVPLIFAADQAPFSVQASSFCVLVPLMSLEGRELADREHSFPDRGRVWWMLRHDIALRDVKPGSLWTGRIENAIKRDQDAFQVVRTSVQRGAKGWLEVLRLPEADPGIARLCGEAGIPAERPTLPRVMVSGGTWCYGPFVASYEEAESRVKLRAPDAGDPQVFRLRWKDLKAGGGLRQFDFESSKFDPHHPSAPLRVMLFDERKLEAVCATGEQVDAQSEAQLVKWALNLCDYSKRERSEFRAALDRLPEAGVQDASREAERLKRFVALCEDRDASERLSIEVAGALAASGPLRDLVEKHLETLTRDRLQQAVDKAEQDIARQTEQARKDKARAEAELREAEAELEARRQTEAAQRKQDHAAFLAELDEREARLQDREVELSRQEQQLEQRLQGVIAEYRENAEGVLRQILTYLPLLGPLDQGGATSASTPARAAPEALARPGFLATAVADGDLDQAGFLDQFGRIAERRGFVFAPEDLLNFHLSVLVGTWTVVAGATGLGKSSLPRLYAEALGMRERYLKLPVQPDWLDDRDVLGAYNSLSECFEPGPTGLVERLIHAELDEAEGLGGIFLICLDEMNLSRVEHYFARFLSILEDPVGQRNLPLMAAGVGRPEDPYTRHRQIALGANLRLVGTVNVDETTHFFSPKVLDRATLMTLSAPDLSARVEAQAAVQELVVQPVPLATWSSWLRLPADPAAELPAAHRLLLDLDATLQGIQSGLGYRLRDRLLAFVATGRELCGEDQAFDMGLAQTVLPRLRTHHPDFVATAGQLLESLPEARFPRSAGILRRLHAAEGAHDFFQLL